MKGGVMKFNRTFEISDFNVKIKRILLEKFDDKDTKFIPIENSAYFHFGSQVNKDSLILPKLYASLTHLTGTSDSNYDDYKGSFSFTFELEVNKNQEVSRYLYHIYHYRSYIEFSVHHIVSDADSRDKRIMHKPNDALFSDEDIIIFSLHFCGFVMGYIEGTKYLPKPFQNYSDSNLLCFGYSDSEYFYKKYDDYEQYHEEKKFCTSSL